MALVLCDSLSSLQLPCPLLLLSSLMFSYVDSLHLHQSVSCDLVHTSSPVSAWFQSQSKSILSKNFRKLAMCLVLIALAVTQTANSAIAFHASASPHHPHSYGMIYDYFQYYINIACDVFKLCGGQWDNSGVGRWYIDRWSARGIFLYSESAETVCRGGCCCVEWCIIYRRRQWRQWVY